MRLAAIGFRAKMFGIEYILEVLVRVQGSICEQLTLRAEIAWLVDASYLVL